MRFCSASGVRSTITVSDAVRGTQSGTVSRTVMPVMERTTGAMLSMCWMLSVEIQSVFAAGDIRMCELIDEDYGGAARKNGVDVHFFEHRALVFNFLSGDSLNLL